MMEREDFVTSLPWYWVIETLARSHELGSSVFPLLYELVSKAPPSLSDSAKKAREALALRCLEDLFRPSDGSRNNCRTSCKIGNGFGLEESCEDVFQHVLRESPGSDLRNDASDELKWDVLSFIERKKACMPRSTLELLKDTIIEGTHPLAVSLREISGVALQNPRVLSVPSGDGDLTSPSAVENCHVNQDMMVEEHHDAVRPGSVNQHACSQSPNENSLLHGRDTSDNVVHGPDDTLCDMENHAPPGKKLKLDKQHSVPFKQPESVPSAGCSKQSNDAEHEHNHQSAEANEMHDGKSCRENVICLDGINVDYHDQSHICPDNDDSLPMKIDLQTKLSFLTSLGAFSQDSLATADTEMSLCMKCNEGGHLLICSVSSCPLAFHENCLGCSASFDDQGGFYCPFCTYSRAISEYAKAKRKVSLTRKELSLFIGGRNTYQPMHDSKKTLAAEAVGQQRQDNNVNNTAEPKYHVNVITDVDNSRQLRSSKGKEQKFLSTASPLAEPQNGEPKNDAHVVTPTASSRQLRSSKGKLQKFSATPTPPAEPKHGTNVADQIYNHRQLRSSKGKGQQLSAPSPPFVENGSAAAALKHVSPQQRQQVESVVNFGTDRMRNKKREAHGSHDCNLPDNNEGITCPSCGCAEMEKKEEIKEHQATGFQRDASSDSISDSDGHSEDEKKATTSLPSPRPLSAIPSNERSRRKKLPWTAEEEAMLKKGVLKFTMGDNKPIPWKNILEYGGSIFHKDRSAGDLKDKWRNIQRGVSPKVK